MTTWKQPVSVLVIIHTNDLNVLLLERAAQPGFWQSVTGSREDNESLLDTARREVFEETGLTPEPGQLTDWRISNVYRIFPTWRHRYAPGVVENTEHVFGLQLAAPLEIRISPREHRNSCWLPWTNAAERCFSWSNRDAIQLLPTRLIRDLKPG